MIKILKELDKILRKLENMVELIESTKDKEPMTDEEIDELFGYVEVKNKGLKEIGE